MNKTEASQSQTSENIQHDQQLQPASLDIWDKKYRLKRSDGEPVDLSIDDTYKRIARALSELEKNDKEAWFDKFLWALKNGAIPAGRIIANAGANGLKPSTSTINCTVSATIHDSMDHILQQLKTAGLTLKAGCGIGYEFSTLRPRGEFVTGAGASTSGPMSFMDIYDKMCFTISSAGGRRGAQMATFDISHPDILEFIEAKSEDGRLRQFNLSLLISEEFINAVENDDEWQLVFPVKANSDSDGVFSDDTASNAVWREWPIKDGYIVNSKGLVRCKIYKTLPARELWDKIMTSTYNYAEPGFILIDRVNEYNNNWFCETIRATNPCGEQPLPPNGACLLGSVNLTSFVVNPFTENAHFDWERFEGVVSIFCRMLDNVVEINGLPHTEQQNEILRKRRHGMGFLGLGSTLTMLKMKYGEKESLTFTEEVSRRLAVAGWRTALELATEKGPAPIMDELFEVTDSMLYRRPEMKADGFKTGDKVEGKVLLMRYSRYMQKLREIEPELVAVLEKSGARYTHHSSIAPTGTISLSLANNASNGIEPSFAHKYSRNIIRHGKKSKEKVDVYSCELLAYQQVVDENIINNIDELPDYFVCSDDISPKQHVDIQAAAQQWIDSSISKTANVPTDYDYEDFKDIYLYAYRKGLKGCTTFRFNPQAFQGVLVKDKDLENTTYVFTLDDGQTIEVKGNDDIEYEGEIHTAANLYDALKEGYYGKL